MRVLLLGARSQLGHDILRTWPEGTVTPLGHEECDVTDAASVRAHIDSVSPDLVVNLAASHRVDDLEADPEPGLRVNAHGAWTVARAAAEVGAAVMWVSTDYVFAGDLERAYREDDAPDPVNAYGATKAAGERLVALANPHHQIIRSSGLYGVAGASGKGGNFLETMIRLGRAGGPLRVVDDQVLGPTSTRDLARGMWAVATSGAYGTFHVTNSGELSWYAFAKRILERTGIAASLQPVTSNEYGAPARRPGHSVLANTRMRDLGLPPLPSVEAALDQYLIEKGHVTG